MEEKKIYQAINSIMKEIGAIGKNQKNQQQNFMFRGIDAVMNAISPALIKYKVFVVPEVLEQIREERQTKTGSNLIYSVCKMKYTFYAEDGSFVEAVVVGEGMDSGDKATNKAMSIAFKYACFQVFCIPTEEMKDPDEECHEVEPKKKQKSESDAVADKKLQKIDAVQLEALKAILAGNGIEEKTVLDLYKLKSLEEVTNQKYENIQSHLEDIKKKQEEKK